MTIIQEIHKWSQNLPAWQQDAVRRLYFDRALSLDDLDDLLAMAKSASGIEDSENRIPLKLEDADLAVQPVPERLVQVTAIKNLVNVNALAEKQNLVIGPIGLTLIYGDNGAGKSGYSRVLKKACRARNQGEKILPDARKEAGEASPPRAEFEAVINGTARLLAWQGGQASPEELSEIAIFDSHCARAYIDNEGDFAYQPFGLDILEALVRACTSVKAMANKEFISRKPNTEAFAVLAKTPTRVGQLLMGLSATTKASDVEELATLSEDELAKLVTLTKALAEAAPQEKAKALQNRASRFTGLASRIDAALSAVDDSKVRGLRELVDKSNRSKEIARLAAEKFNETPGLLAGTGSDLWEEMFDAARRYAATSHPHHEFPRLPPDAACPLCQTALGEVGVSNLLKFDQFIQHEAEKTAKAARATATAAYRAIDHAALDLQIDEALGKELQDAFPENFGDVAIFQQMLRDRRTAAMQAAGSVIAWESIQPMPASPSSKLVEKAALLSAEVKALEASMDLKARAEMVHHQADLEARLKLAELKPLVLTALAGFIHNAKLKACADGITVTGISRKSTDLSEKMATKEVLDALNAELRALNCHELQVAMKPESPKGKTQYKLRMQLPGGGSPSAILSEGEQRAIAIASFLAEVKLGKGLGGIVFDDPVSSLDHRRRWHVAKRLVEESKRRQVIVFTHDIYFLCIIQQHAELAHATVSTQCIGRGAGGFGVQTDRLPFDTMSTSKRVKELRRMHENVAKIYKLGDEPEATRLSREAYSHLRMAWERGVEEVLLQGTVIRFDEGVHTQKLRGVVVEDGDCDAVNAGMTKCSKFSGHDPANAAQIPTLHPDELLQDINELEAWRVFVEARKATAEARRK